MAKIKLRKYQEDAVKFALDVPKCALCMKVGSGKTVCAIFASRLLLKRGMSDKIVIACSKSSVSVFQQDFKEKAGVNVKLIEKEEKFVDFLTSDTKVCIIKHSMFSKAGSDKTILKALRKLEDTVNVTLIIDEAHKIQNPQGLAQEGYHRMGFIFKRVILLTATPYSSCLSQFYGLLCLIHPELWKNKNEFFSMYIEELIIRDPKTHRPVRREKVCYKNLAEFRKRIEPYVYFYYPPVPLVHIEHHTSLQDYTEYDQLCKGILREEDIKKIENKEKE